MNTNFERVIKTGLAGPMRSGKFKKSALNFRRRHGSTVQLINLQNSSSSDESCKRFYVNVVIGFDEICTHWRRPIEQRAWLGDNRRSIYLRLEEVVPSAPDRWELRTDDESDTVAHALTAAMNQLIAAMNAIDSLRAFRQHPWFEHLTHEEVVGRCLYVLGEHGAARLWVNQQATRIADERGDDPALLVNKLIKRYELDDLLLEFR